MFDEVIHHAYMNGISVNGDYYRANAQVVAAAASVGFLSTESVQGVFTRSYRPTAAGLQWMQGTAW